MSKIEEKPPTLHRLARPLTHTSAAALVLMLFICGTAQPPVKIPYGEDALLLTLSRVRALPENEIPQAMQEMVQRVRQRGVSFRMSPATASKFRKLGAPPALLAAMGEEYRAGGKPPVSGGVLDSKAVRLPQPAYPLVAKAARIGGEVTVEVVVDEAGKVIWAEALSGHPLLMKAAVDAAMQAEFTPAKLSGQPVKMTGLITYVFMLQ